MPEVAATAGLAPCQTLTLYTPAGLAKVFISGAASASSAVERKSAGLMREVSVKLLRPAGRPSFIATVVEKLLEPISKKVTGSRQGQGYRDKQASALMHALKCLEFQLSLMFASFGGRGRRTRENLQRSWREALALTQGESQTSRCEATVPTTVVWMGLSIEISSILIGDG